MNALASFHGGMLGGTTCEVDVEEPPVELVFAAAVKQGAVETTYRLETVSRLSSDAAVCCYVVQP